MIKEQVEKKLGEVSFVENLALCNEVRNKDISKTQKEIDEILKSLTEKELKLSSEIKKLETEIKKLETERITLKREISNFNFLKIHIKDKTK